VPSHFLIVFRIIRHFRLFDDPSFPFRSDNRESTVYRYTHTYFGLYTRALIYELRHTCIHIIYTYAHAHIHTYIRNTLLNLFLRKCTVAALEDFLNEKSLKFDALQTNPQAE
jgi:hypothetical protein